MSFFSWLSTAEGAFRFCEIVAIIAGLLTVAALIGKDIAGRMVADRKAKEMLALQKDVADARTRQADAEMKLEEVRKKASPRSLPGEKFKSFLKDKPKGKVGFLYLENDSEAFQFAVQIMSALSEIGWKASMPAPLIPPPANADDLLGQHLPGIMRAGVGGSLTIVCKLNKIPPTVESDPLLWTFIHAFMHVGFPSVFSNREPASDHDVIIIVGPKL